MQTPQPTPRPVKARRPPRPREGSTTPRLVQRRRRRPCFPRARNTWASWMNRRQARTLMTGVLGAGILPLLQLTLNWELHTLFLAAFIWLQRVPQVRASSWSVPLTVLLMAASLTASPAPKTPTNQTGDQTAPTLTAFWGYDCSRPTQMEAVHPRKLQDCSPGPARIQSRRNTTMVVLQKADYSRVPATRCQWKESRLPYYCGVYSHVTLEGDGVTIRKPVAMTAAQCQRLAVTGKIRLGLTNNQERSVPKGIPTQITYYQTGRTIYANSDHIECEGGSYYHDYNKQSYSRVVDLRIADFLIQDVTLAIAEDDTITEVRDRITLPCRSSTGYCTAPSGNYVWKPPVTEDEKCKLYQARTVQGEVVQDDDGKKAFIATDGTALHLLITGTRYMCGREVMSTNHDIIFLTEDTTVPAFQRELDPTEMSAATFGSAQVQFSENHVAAYVEQSMRQLRAEQCLGQMEAMKPLELLAAGQLALSRGETVSLGGGEFASVRGEAFYTYRCAPIRANAITRDRCFDALPVKISDPDRRAHFQARGEADRNGTQFYLEPKTHMLRTDAAPQECIPQMAPLWKNAQGQWITVNPAIVAAPPPRHLIDPAQKVPTAEFNPTDYGRGGLYTPSQIRVMDQERQLPNRIHEIGLSMAERSGTSGWHADATEHTMIADDVLSLSRAWYVNPADWLWARLQELGHLGSILVALSMLVKLGTWIMGVGMRFYYGRMGDIGSIRHLCQVLFPSAVLMFQRMEDRRASERLRENRMEMEEWETQRAKRDQGPGLPEPRKAYPPLPDQPDPGMVNPLLREPESPYANPGAPAAQ